MNTTTNQAGQRNALAESIHAAEAGDGSEAEPQVLVKPSKPIADTTMLGAAGGGLLALAAAYLWRDLSLSPAHLVTAGATVGLGASMALSHRRISGLGILGLFGATLAGGVWYAMSRSAFLLPAMAIVLLGAGLNVALAYPRARQLGDKMRSGQIFALFALAVLTATSAGYFHFLTLGVESLGRRLVLSLLWSLVGVGLVVASGKWKEVAMRYSGYAVLMAAMCKVLLYDTTHLSGNLRVGVLGLAGLVLVGGSLLLRRRPAQN